MDGKNIKTKRTQKKHNKNPDKQDTDTGYALITEHLT
jgi:hypothetical protein